jgi:septal ring factor EnvC (AmiA/AmiB activator)
MDTETRERFERIEGRMDRVEANLLQISETMKEFSAGMKELSAGMRSLRRSQAKTNKVLQTLLDALFTQRGNGHSK